MTERYDHSSPPAGHDGSAAEAADPRTGEPENVPAADDLQGDILDRESTGPVIRDRRRIDPETGQVRTAPDRPEATASPGSPAGTVTPPPETTTATGERTSLLEREIAERVADVQRIQAEYANYRKRVERDRHAVREQALASVLAELLPVLDDIGRAREHGELTGGFKSVAERLETTLGKLGLVAFGEPGEPFDPTVHEALMHHYSPDVTTATSVDILQPGYRVGDRILRAARVSVAEPSEAEQPSGEAGDAGTG